MKILVTGSGGFVGCNLCLRLLEQGHEVVASYRSAEPPFLRELNPEQAGRVILSKGDLTDRQYVASLASERVSGIINSAIMTSPARPEKEYFADMARVNIEGTVNLLELALRGNVPNYVYVSSFSVYGAQFGRGELMGEDGPFDLDGTYPTTKRASELLTARYGKLSGAKAVSARIAVPYGPYEHATPSRTVLGAVCGMVESAAAGRPVKIAGREIERDWTYVDDTVEALLLLLFAAPETLRHVEYNVSCGQSYSNEAVAAALKAVCPTFEYSFVDNISEADIYVSPPRQRGIGDISRLTQDTGFRPRFSLTAGLEKYLDHVRKSRAAE